jgi:hypothetical protein
MKFDIELFFENLLRTFKFNQNLTSITCILREDRYTFLIISCLVLLRMGIISEEICRENQNTTFILKSLGSIPL